MTVQRFHAQKLSVSPPIRNSLIEGHESYGQSIANSNYAVESPGRTHKTLQRAAVNINSANEVPQRVQDALHSPGQPLDAQMRAFMEPRFNHDFSNVRVHTDATAAESARTVNAVAYTVGSDMVFDAGQYAPHTVDGRKLIAHELTHVIQQSGSSGNLQRQINMGSERSSAEGEADRVAEQIVDEPETTVEGYQEIEQIVGAIQPVAGQLQRRCRKNPPDAPYAVDVNFDIGATPAPNHSHSTAWISARAQDSSGQTAGLTQFTAGIRWSMSFQGNQVALRRFTARFQNARIRIFLTNQFQRGSCQYNDLLRHEQQHDTDFRMNAAEAEARICDHATAWPSPAFPLPSSNISQADLRTLINEWMTFENWQLDYDNWYDGCIWDTVDYPRMYAGCPGVTVAQPQAHCRAAPQRPVQQGLPLPQRAPR